MKITYTYKAGIHTIRGIVGGVVRKFKSDVSMSDATSQYMIARANAGDLA